MNYVAYKYPQIVKGRAIVHLPCINHSETAVSLKGTDAWVHLIGIQELETSLIEAISYERRANGDFSCLEILQSEQI